MEIELFYDDIFTCNFCTRSEEMCNLSFSRRKIVLKHLPATFYCFNCVFLFEQQQLFRHFNAPGCFQL